MPPIVIIASLGPIGFMRLTDTIRYYLARYDPAANLIWTDVIEGEKTIK
jgi:hypothetical protein